MTWKRQLGDGVQCPHGQITAYDEKRGRIYVLSNRGLHAVAIQTGKVEWVSKVAKRESMSFSAKANVIAVSHQVRAVDGFVDTKVEFFDVQKRTMLRRTVVMPGTGHIAFAPGAPLLFFAGTNRSIEILDFDNKWHWRIPNASADRIRRLRFALTHGKESPSDRLALFAMSKRTVRVWFVKHLVNKLKEQSQIRSRAKKPN